MKAYKVADQNLSLLHDDVECCWLLVRKFFTNHKLQTNGCKTFYTPEAWAARKEELCQGALINVVYDGSEVKRCFNGGDLAEKFREYLEGFGYVVEEGLHWYSGIYWKH